MSIEQELASEEAVEKVRISETLRDLEVTTKERHDPSKTRAKIPYQDAVGTKAFEDTSITEINND